MYVSKHKSFYLQHTFSQNPFYIINLFKCYFSSECAACCLNVNDSKVHYFCHSVCDETCYIKPRNNFWIKILLKTSTFRVHWFACSNSKTHYLSIWYSHLIISPCCFTSHLLLHVMPDVFILFSEFEELDQVSTINESAIESSSAAVAVTDAVEDSVFTNFFNVCFLVVYRFSCHFAEYLSNVNFQFGFSFYDYMICLWL